MNQKVQENFVTHHNRFNVKVIQNIKEHLKLHKIQNTVINKCVLLAHNDQFEFDIVSFRIAYNISVGGKPLNSDKTLNGKTLNSALKLQIKKKNNQATAKFKPPSNEGFQKIRNSTNF